MFVRVVELTQNGERLVAGVIGLKFLKDGPYGVGYASKLFCLDVAKGACRAARGVRASEDDWPGRPSTIVPVYCSPRDNYLPITDCHSVRLATVQTPSFVVIFSGYHLHRWMGE